MGAKGEDDDAYRSNSSLAMGAIQADRDLQHTAYEEKLHGGDAGVRQGIQGIAAAVGKTAGPSKAVKSGKQRWGQMKILRSVVSKLQHKVNVENKIGR